MTEPLAAATADGATLDTAICHSQKFAMDSQPLVVRAGGALTAGSPGCVAQARLIVLRTAA